ncbi:uncharacterized protein MYCFIDRAFT_171405 [Pseudocercospora fijiensis CIRAD86]|uniref:Uncharacterized protein n=1 Tax=Pseudocercospora fijiensis (strain CIRAD86) TaxID=383855 RepID=M3B832_PSEFD|nr:uncharacterized protein MYCFIDRAFT_171405 [Pseudocercospora fijiensis CIRAD86]EME85478.1 hypothetical protein MYCFIDRAFT_171405 [Pseudocercospora fijiensis CIRAD86]
MNGLEVDAYQRKCRNGNAQKKTPVLPAHDRCPENRSETGLKSVRCRMCSEWIDWRRIGDGGAGAGGRSNEIGQLRKPTCWPRCCFHRELFAMPKVCPRLGFNLSRDKVRYTPCT